jgi:hypothetical protein
LIHAFTECGLLIPSVWELDLSEIKELGEWRIFLTHNFVIDVTDLELLGSSKSRRMRFHEELQYILKYTVKSKKNEKV